jgi:hypothetical protein
MTKLLEKALETVRGLPEDAQNEIARAMLNRRVTIASRSRSTRRI